MRPPPPPGPLCLSGLSRQTDAGSPSPGANDTLVLRGLAVEQCQHLWHVVHDLAGGAVQPRWPRGNVLHVPPAAPALAQRLAGCGQRREAGLEQRVHAANVAHEKQELLPELLRGRQTDARRARPAAPMRAFPGAAPVPPQQRGAVACAKNGEWEVARLAPTSEAGTAGTHAPPPCRSKACRGGAQGCGTQSSQGFRVSASSGTANPSKPPPRGLITSKMAAAGALPPAALCGAALETQKKP
jgi:hypothetical protein